VRRLGRALIVVVLGLGGLLLGASTAFADHQTAAERLPTTTPVKHFIFLMQENHSFDNYFGTYPGADGIPDGTCMPDDPADPSAGCVRPYHIGDKPITDLGHTARVFDGQLNAGANDGFVSAFTAEGDRTDQAMGYYDGRDIPYYWNVADNYVLFDRFFTSARGGSVWNHMYWIAGVPGSTADSIPPEGLPDTPTIFDRLEEAGVSWTFYVQNYDPTITYKTYVENEDSGRNAQVVWAPLLALPRYVDDPELFSHIAPLDQYYDDLANGTLPAVSYIVPSGASEHPPGSIQAGERFVRTLHTALMRSSAWSSSAFLWAYDDWGGWYDHVVPPQVDEHGYGYRTPALLVSPYAKTGVVDSTPLDFTSGLAFIEQNWGVAPLAQRDAQAQTFLSAFDFDQEPREPQLVPDTRAQVAPLTSPTSTIYASYALAPAVALVVAAVGGLESWRRRRGPR
jgi:phospholipase C